MDKEIYGYTSAELFPYRGKVMWRKGRKGKFERYIEMALADIVIPADTVIVITNEKRAAYDMSEIAPAEEKGEDFFVIFMHEFSVAEIKQSILRIDEFFPEFAGISEEDTKRYIIAFIQKVIMHELGHRADWKEHGLFTDKKAEERGELRDNEDEAEAYAWTWIQQKYGDKFTEQLRKVAFSVFVSEICSEKEAEIRELKAEKKRKKELAEKIDKKMREGVSFEEFVKLHREVLKEV